MTRLISLIFVLTLLAAAPAPAAPNTPPDNFVEITPDVRKAVDRGLAYLASVQNDDGSIGANRYGRNAGISSLACLAWMADGNLPGRGKYAKNVERGLDFVLSCANETGLIAADVSHGPMYDHGFATLFLGEIYGMTGDRRIRETLVKAVRLINNSQNDEGGWRYRPEPADADVSVTICQVMALRSAREAGLHVPKEKIEKAIKYVRDCQNPDGGFRYMLNSGGSAFPRSAAGVATLYYAGVYEDDAIRKGLEYLMLYRNQMSSYAIGHYYYGHYYAAQAMYLAGGNYWSQWFPAVRRELLLRQEPDGKWSDAHGESFGTAMATIILQMPNRYLPIFQR